MTCDSGKEYRWERYLPDEQTAISGNPVLLAGKVYLPGWATNLTFLKDFANQRLCHVNIKC
jgi:hypothetical protein